MKTTDGMSKLLASQRNFIFYRATLLARYYSYGAMSVRQFNPFFQFRVTFAIL